VPSHGLAEVPLNVNTGVAPVLAAVSEELSNVVIPGRHGKKSSPGRARTGASSTVTVDLHGGRS